MAEHFPIRLDAPSGFKVLIIKMWDLGQILAATPLARAIKRFEPRAEVHWLCDSAYAMLLAPNPSIDRVIAFDSAAWRADARRGSIGRHLRCSAWLHREMAAEHYDIVIDLAADGWWTLGLTPASMRVGVFSGSTPGLKRYVYTDAVIRRHGAREHDTTLALRAAAVLGMAGPYDEQTELVLSDADRRAAFALLRSDNAYLPSRQTIVFHPAAMHATRRWPLEYFADLADRMIACNIVVTGTAHDRVLAERIGEMCRRRIVKAAGRLRGIGETAAMIERADALVAGDTSVIQIASALDVPLVGVYGASRPGTSEPLYGRFELLYDDSVACAPCNRGACRLAGHAKLTCLRSVTPAAVANSLLGLGIGPGGSGYHAKV